MRIARLLPGVLALMLVSSPATAQVGKGASFTDPNRATEQELLALPNVTPALAKEIVAKRPFLTFKAFDAVVSAAGLTAEQKTELYGKSWVHVNLNTAAKEEILLIPGVGNKMLHEFEEYRPYKALAQFRREIGKYVNAQELARLEGYVFVPIDLNTATDADILTIPGLGNRMLHEFKEYRPYKSIEQFRREIGKYVDAKEVARLERYVELGK